MPRAEGKTVAITGASSGDEAIALFLTERGANRKHPNRGVAHRHN